MTKIKMNKIEYNKKIFEYNRKIKKYNKIVMNNIIKDLSIVSEKSREEIIKLSNIKKSQFNELAGKYFVLFLEKKLQKLKSETERENMFSFEYCANSLGPDINLLELAYCWWWKIAGISSSKNYSKFMRIGEISKYCLSVPLYYKDYKSFETYKKYEHYKKMVFDKINSDPNYDHYWVIQYIDVKEELIKQLLPFVKFNFLLKTGFRIEDKHDKK